MNYEMKCINSKCEELNNKIDIRCNIDDRRKQECWCCGEILQLLVSTPFDMGKGILMPKHTKIKDHL